MATADLLLELMFSWIEQRERCAEQLRKLARELESLRENCNASECVGSTVAVAGAVSLIGAGVATFFTAGAAAPFLGVLGAAYTGVGVTVSLATKITEHFISSDTMKEAQKIEKKSNEIAEKIQKLFQQLKAERKEVSCFADPDDLDRHVMTEILRATARRSGLKEQINVRMVDDEPQIFFGAEPRNMRFNQILFRPEVTVGLAAGVLTFFAFQASGKKSKLLFAQGAKSLIKQVSTTGFKTALKGGAMVVGGAVGLAFALPEAIDKWKDQIKKNHVTEASKSLRDTADAILKISQTLTEQLDKIKKMFEKLAEVKRCIENKNRSSEEEETLIEFAIKQCEDEAVRRWLRENWLRESEAIFKLVDMFYFLEQELKRKKKKKKKDFGGHIDIIFVAHGGIEESMIPASALLPPSIEDVVLYSPWNCAINADVAYGVATGNIKPQHRIFYCTDEDCDSADILHQPTNLPNSWNSMKAAGRWPIPNISVSPVGTEEEVWKEFEFLEDKYGQPGENRIVIRFIVPGETDSSVEEIEVPFFVVTYILSLVLSFSCFKATVHLAACLSKTYEGRTLNEPYLKQQYACTIDSTGMTAAEEMLLDRDTDLYRALKAVFG